MNLVKYSRMSEEERMKYLQNIDEQNKELMEHSASALKRIRDGKPVNVNLLKEMSEPEMRLYFIGNNYFQSIDELLQYCKVNKLSTNESGILEYYKNLAGRSDVIKKQSNATFMLYTVIDEDGYGIYNYERSIYRGQFTWEYSHGSIREMYKPFRERGIIFEDDIYAKQDDENKQLLKMCKEKNLFSGKIGF